MLLCIQRSMVSSFPVRFLLHGVILYIQQLSHPQFFTERSMMLLLGIPKILLKLSIYVFYHGVLVLVSQSSLNSVPPALIPQHAVCFTTALFGLYHTQFPSLQPKNRSGSCHWPLHRVKLSPSTSGWGTDKCWVYAQPGQSKGWYFLMLVEKSHWTAQHNLYISNI